MEIRAIDLDVISIETKQGEIITLRRKGDGVFIKTRTSSFLIDGGYLVEHVEDNNVKLKRKEK
jgi:hypothetical protein